MVVELRDPASSQTPVFWKFASPPAASVETPAAREPAQGAAQKSRKTRTNTELAARQACAPPRTLKQSSIPVLSSYFG